MKLKDEINMNLDLYFSELSSLKEDAKLLYEKVCSRSKDYWSNHPSEYNQIYNQIQTLSIRQHALEECKNDSITDS